MLLGSKSFGELCPIAVYAATPIEALIKEGMTLITKPKTAPRTAPMSTLFARNGLDFIHIRYRTRPTKGIRNAMIGQMREPVS